MTSVANRTENNIEGAAFRLGIWGSCQQTYNNCCSAKLTASQKAVTFGRQDVAARRGGATVERLTYMASTSIDRTQFCGSLSGAMQKRRRHKEQHDVDVELREQTLIRTRL